MELQLTDNPRPQTADAHSEVWPEAQPLPVLTDKASHFLDAVFGAGTCENLSLTQEHVEPVFATLEKLSPTLLDSGVNQARFLALLAGKSYDQIAVITNATNANSVGAMFWNLKKKVTADARYDQADAFAMLRDELTDYRAHMEGYEPVTARQLLADLIDRDPTAVYVQNRKVKRQPRRTPDTSRDMPIVTDPIRPRNDADPDETHYDGFNGKEYTAQNAQRHAENVRRLAEKVIDRTGISKPAAGYETSNLIYADAYVGYEDIRLRRSDVIRLGAAAAAHASGAIALPRR